VYQACVNLWVLGTSSGSASIPRILVVDDEDGIRECLRDILVDEGYQVDEARDGREALESIARAGAPSIILLDLTMPVMNGWELLQHLRSQGHLPGLPVVVITAAPTDPATLTGIRQLVKKPFVLDEVLALVAALCAPTQ
jgi:two-component system, chemotaxis family, chemotaxis protein CheY